MTSPLPSASSSEELKASYVAKMSPAFSLLMKSSNKLRQGEELKLSKVAADIPTGEIQAIPKIPKREIVPS